MGRAHRAPDASAQRLDVLLYAMGRGEAIATPWWRDRPTSEQKRLARDLARMDAEEAEDELRARPGAGRLEAPWDGEGHAAGGDAA